MSDLTTPAAVGRIIWTAEDLKALPAGSVVVDNRGTARQKRYANSHMPYGWTCEGNGPLTDAELADGHPMLILHVGRNVPHALARAEKSRP